MKITIVGTGYVGLVTGAGLTDLGNDVICLDINEEKISNLKKGDIPIYEPGLSDIVKKNIKEKRLSFTTSYKEALKDHKIVFLCLPTPEKSNGDADLKYFFYALDDIAKYMESETIIVTKSTVPVGTNRRIMRYLKSKTRRNFYVVSNPEFLKEGAAVSDFKNPDRIVVGGNNKKSINVIVKLYKPLERTNRPIITTTLENAELIKYASNAMLSTRISFMNELANLCEVVGADITEVAKGVGLDTRIGPRFLHAGIGYGGSCFPKDVKALAYSMEQRGITSNLLRSVDYINELQKKSFVPKMKKLIGSLHKKNIGIWGLSFKPKTDDIRRAPSIDIIDQLLVSGANIIAYDPKAMDNIRKEFGNKIRLAKNMYDALKGVDVLIVLTEWDSFRNPDFKRMKRLMKKPIIFDGRNIYPLETMKENKFTYFSIGRRPLKHK